MLDEDQIDYFRTTFGPGPDRLDPVPEDDVAPKPDNAPGLDANCAARHINARRGPA